MKTEELPPSIKDVLVDIIRSGIENNNARRIPSANWFYPELSKISKNVEIESDRYLSEKKSKMQH